MLPPDSGAEGAPRERKEIPMSQRRQRLYRRLDRAERAAIERGLDKNRPGKGSRVESVPEGACARLRGWPHVCNGRDKRRYRCSMPFRCEYSAARAQLLADGELSAARRGVSPHGGGVRVHRRQDQGRPGPRPVAGADSRRPLVRVQGRPLHHLPLDRAGLRRHVQHGTCAARWGTGRGGGRRPRRRRTARSAPSRRSRRSRRASARPPARWTR